MKKINKVQHSFPSAHSLLGDQAMPIFFSVGFFVFTVGVFAYEQDKINTLQAQLADLQAQQRSSATTIEGLNTDAYLLRCQINSNASAIQVQANKYKELQSDVDDLKMINLDTQERVKAFQDAVILAAPTIELARTWDGPELTQYKGVNYGPSGRETYYNLYMGTVVKYMRDLGYSESEYQYWVRDDGVKMFGKYVMVAANLKTRPKGTILETSLGWGIVVDTGTFVETYPDGIDIAVNWE